MFCSALWGDDMLQFENTTALAMEENKPGFGNQINLNSREGAVISPKTNKQKKPSFVCISLEVFHHK